MPLSEGEYGTHIEVNKYRCDLGGSCSSLCEFFKGLVTMTVTGITAIIPVVYKRKRCFNWFVVVANSNLNCVESFC